MTAATGRLLAVRQRVDLVVLGVLLVAGAGAGAVTLAGDRSSVLYQARLSWTLSVFFELGAFFYARRTARLLAVGDPARRFWRVYCFATLAFAAGNLSQLVMVAVRPATTDLLLGGPVFQVLLGTGTLALLVVMALYPLGLNSVRERWCFVLDLATVMVAGSVFGWYFTDASIGVFATLTRPGLIIVVVFAATKVLLAAGPPFTMQAGLLGVTGATVGAAGGTLGPTLLADGRSVWFYAAGLSGDALLMACARVQSRHIGTDPDAAYGRRRSYSVLPYVAVGTTFVLLGRAVATGTTDQRTWLVLGGAAVSTGLVIIRQIISFADNSRLLAELRRTERGLRSALDERNALADQLREMAYQDALTGLANRAMFNDRLTGALSRARRQHSDVLVLLLDLDQFKQVNDDHGHAAGDAVLRAAGHRMRSCLRDSDTVARLGGDEFGIVIEAPLPLDVEGLRRRLEQAVREPVEFGTARLSVGISIGVAYCHGGDGDAESLLQQADAAMYGAKRGPSRQSAATAPTSWAAE